MATLAGNTIASTYALLLKIDSSGIDTTLRAVEDGDATDSALLLATNKVEVKPGSNDANAFEVSQADGTAVLTVNTSTVGATLIGALTVGADDLGHDVIFYGDTASSNMTWDTSEDDLVLNDATLFIDQDDNADCINIDFEGTSGNCIEIQAPTSTTGTCLLIQNANSLTTGGCAEFHSNSSDTSTRNVVYISNDHASATGTTALHIQQDAPKEALMIDMNANDKALNINTTATSSYGLIVQGDSLTTGKLAYFYSASTTNDGRNLVDIVNANSGADGTKCLNIQQEAANIALRIDQNANSNSIYIDSESTTTEVININAPTQTTAAVIAIDGADNLTSGSLVRLHSESAQTNARNLLVVHNDSATADSAVPLYVVQDGNTRCISALATETAYGDIMLHLTVYRSGDSGFNFLRTFSNGDSDNQHILRGDGEVLADGGSISGDADYAEYFESKDEILIAVGTTVKLDGDKVVACEDGDTPIGVIRPNCTSSVIGNASPFKWQGKYLMDDYGSPVKEEYTVTEWMEDSDEVKEEAVEGKAVVYRQKDIQYQTDKIPSDVTVPSDAKVTSKEKDGSKLMRKKLNPNYDESQSYTSREERDEWHIVGLLGQIPITKGQPVASTWIKMKDVSDTVEMYFVK